MSDAITVKRLPSGYWLLRGQGPCNFAQVQDWPCAEAHVRESAFPEASEAFIRAAVAAAKAQEGTR